MSENDTDVMLSFQQLVNLWYRRGRYDDIDYSQPPDPPLGDDDARWARELLARDSQNRQPSTPIPALVDAM